MIRHSRPGEMVPAALATTALVLLIGANVAGLRALQGSDAEPMARAAAIRAESFEGAPIRPASNVGERRPAAAAMHLRSQPIHKRASRPRPAQRVVLSTPAAGSAGPQTVAVPTTTRTPEPGVPSAPRATPQATPPPAQTTPVPVPRSTPTPAPAPPTTFDERGTAPDADTAPVQFDDSGPGESPIP
jgi:hypothetical protein